jgi:hypothetical protein
MGGGNTLLSKELQRANAERERKLGQWQRKVEKRESNV